MTFTVKNSKAFRTNDGYAWSATIYMDGVKLCYAFDQGRGGEVRIDWASKEAETKFGEYVASLPADMDIPAELLARYPEGMKRDAGDVIARIVDNYENTKREASTLKRWCKTKTIFRLKGDEVGTYRNVKNTFNPQVKLYLVGKYGDTIETIVNETLAA